MNSHIDLSGVYLYTDRLCLRPWLHRDLLDLYEYASVPGVGEMAGWRHHKSIAESERVLNYLIITRKTFALTLNDKVIGSLGVDNYDTELFPELQDKLGRELGFTLSRDYWGQGIMDEAVEAVCRWLFSELHFDFILCGCFEDNFRSVKLQEKCGFKFFCKAKLPDAMGNIRNARFSIIYKEDFK